MDRKKAVLCIVETIVFNVAMYVFFFLLQPNQDVYLQLNPHPLFLLCIAMGMRYGNYLGMVSATISSLFYTKVFLFLYNDLALLFSHFGNYKYILLFFWSAMVFGFFKDNYTATVEKLSMEKKLLEDNYNQLKKTNQLTQKLHRELKKQIIGSEESILHLYEIASRLETLESEEVYTETIGILSKYLKADAVSIYTYNEESGYLRLKIRTGNNDIDSRSLSVKDSPGFCKVVHDKQAVRWTDVREENFPLMSAPVMKGDRVLAVVNIVHMDFDRLSEYAFQLFRLVIDWVNKALDRAIYVDGLRDSKYLPGTKLLRIEAYEERLKSEERRKKEFGMIYSTLKYRLKSMDIGAIDEKIGRIVRAVDVVSFDPDLGIMHVLLPATPQDQLPIVEKRIFDHFGDLAKKIGEKETA